MRLIDADALKIELGETNMDIFIDEVKQIVDEAPTIDAVPLEQYRSMERTCYKLQKALYEMADQTERDGE